MMIKTALMTTGAVVALLLMPAAQAAPVAYQELLLKGKEVIE